MRKIITSLLVAVSLCTGSVCGADNNTQQEKENKDGNIFKRTAEYFNENNVLNHLDVGVSLGTTGIGVDFTLPIGSQVNVRTGVAYMPPISVPMHFDLMNYTEDGSEITESTFDKAKELMQTLTGFEVNRSVQINGKPNMFTFKFLFDVYPFRNNKHWRVTAGFYIGPKKIATAINDMAEMPTLVSVGIYNGLYDRIMETDFIETPIYEDFYLDPDLADELKARLSGYGRIGVHVGDYVGTGKPYLMEPDKDGTVSANAYVNVFRPYLGFGYTTSLDKAKRWNFSVDCGAMFWGGHPKIVTHEGVDLTTDVENISGKVGDYVDIAKAMKVYPVLNFRISYAVF